MEVEYINSLIEAIQKQRNSALDRLAYLEAELAQANRKLKALEDERKSE